MLPCDQRIELFADGFNKFLVAEHHQNGVPQVDIALGWYASFLKDVRNVQIVVLDQWIGTRACRPSLKTTLVPFRP